MRARVVVVALGAVVVLAAAFAVAGRGDATAAQPSPRARASASLRDPGTVPATVRAVAERGAIATGGDPATARSSIRPLRTGLGLLKHSLYAFKAAPDSRCLLLSSRGMTCSRTPNPELPGLVWMVAGGYPQGAIGNAGEIPSAFVGVVDDSVARIDFTANGLPTLVPIENNSLYVELPLHASPRETMEVALSYEDGTRRTLMLHDPRL